MTIASFRVSGAVVAVFVLLTVTFVLLTIGAFDNMANITKAGGWVGMATAAAAWYASFAGVVNETFKKPIVPILPLGARHCAADGGRNPCRLTWRPRRRTISTMAEQRAR